MEGTPEIQFVSDYIIRARVLAAQLRDLNAQRLVEKEAEKQRNIRIADENVRVVSDTIFQLGNEYKSILRNQQHQEITIGSSEYQNAEKVNVSIYTTDPEMYVNSYNFSRTGEKVEPITEEHVISRVINSVTNIVEGFNQ